MIREDVRIKAGARKKISNSVLLYYLMGNFIFSFDIYVKESIVLRSWVFLG